MPLDISIVTDKKFSSEIQKSSHLLNYLSNYIDRGNPIPLFTAKLEAEHKKLKDPNLIYPIADSIYIHINPHANSADGFIEYTIIEPDEPDRDLMENADKLFSIHAGTMNPIFAPVKMARTSATRIFEIATSLLATKTTS